MRFQDKVALVTGGSSGIGLATVELLAGEGAKVLAVDVQEPTKPLPDGVDFAHLDVTDEHGWKQVVDGLIEAEGRIDVLIQVAGITTYPTIHEETTEGWNRVIATNTTGMFFGMREVIPHMLAAKRGAIVNTSSHFAVIAIPSMASYHASKGAVTALSRNAAITYASAGIRVNAVHPGPTMTPLLMETPEEALNAVAAVVPLGRIAEPHEQASAILFLASDDASYVTGHSLLVDGGYTAA